ncbi:MAG: AAA family ATPase [Ilumatobacter sp.]|nr:AAA family ATPase [Ilumatobacter sp.]
MACRSCSRPLPEGARFCPFCGHEVIGAATEERRVVTVLFADIVGYSTLSEHLDPERVKRLVDGAFQRLVADINAFGGRVDKIVGDGILAMFGAPVAHEDDPDRAIRAALQMHQSIAQFSTGQLDLDAPLQLRVGVNTGEVLVGSMVGTDDYTAMGDVVNVASRLQVLAPPGAVYIGDATAQLASDEIRREPIEDVEVRGRVQTERVWHVTGRERLQPMSGGRAQAPFVGRATQRELLQSVMTMVANGRSAVVSVSGEAGAGKTRLVTEALADFPSRRVTIFAGVCAPYGENNAWAPIASALFRQLELDTSVTPAELRAIVREQASARLGFVAEDPTLDRLVEAVLHLVGHPSDLDDVTPTEAREMLVRLIVEGFRMRSRWGPIVLWLDDLQWADPLLIDLLHRLSRSLVDRPVLVVTAQRDDVVVDWPPSTDHPMTIRMPLEPFTRDEAGMLLDLLLGGNGGSPLADQLYERSGGNPFFLTELAELARSNPESTQLPGSLRALIAARLDRLDPAARAVLDNAAVLGTSGPVSSLERFAVELGQSFTPDDVARLERDGLLDIDGPIWRFRSDVVREVSYQMLTKMVRAQRHAGVAAVMGEIPMIPTDLVAHHSATAAELVGEIGPVERVRSDIKAEAVRLLLRAVRRSLDVGGFHQSGIHATRAIDLGPDDPADVRELRLLRAEAAVGQRERERARVDAEAALAAAHEAGDLRHEGRARRYLGQIAQMAGDLDVARRQLSRSVDIFRELHDDIELAASLRERGFAEVFGGSLDDAEWLLGEAEGLSESLDDRRGMAWVRQHQAWVAFLAGNIELAEQRLLLASREFSELGDRSGSNWATGLLAYVRFYAFRFEEAEALAVAVRAEGLEAGERWGSAMMDSLLASIRLWSGDFGEAEELSRRAVASFRAIDDRFGLVQALVPRTRALVALGRDHEAARGLEEVLAIGDSFGNLAFPVMAAAGTAVHLGLGERAVVLGEVASERVAKMGADGDETATTLALAFCQVGDPERALTLLAEAEVDFPYALAVRAVAAAMTGDDEHPAADADAVWAVEGSSYLDRVIADVAAAAAALRGGRHDEARERLDRATATADAAGDVVARALAGGATQTLLGGGVTMAMSHHLRPGWRRVLDGLSKAALVA